MSNPFYGAFQNAPGSDPMSQMIAKFKQFKSAFQGDARQEIQRLLNSGEMTQNQFNQLQMIANQYQSFFK